jgi:hypothetical protein
MILASSSGDHLDCFLAGEAPTPTWSWPDSRFAGTEDRVDGWVVEGGKGATLVATLDGTDSERELVALNEGELVDWPASSSLASRRDEISTMRDGKKRGEGSGGGSGRGLCRGRCRPSKDPAGEGQEEGGRR